MRAVTSIILAGAAASQIGSTDCGNALRDSGFDLWCGDRLCAWKVERGEIRRVATWNDGDPGVEFVGSDAAIEQLSPVDSGDGTCLEFSLIANIDPSADVELNVDVLGDGTIEHTERLPASNWKPLSYQILVKAPYAGIRFEIAKKGNARAQLANIGAKVVKGCGGQTALDPSPRPLGTPCTLASDCASGICGNSYPEAIAPFAGFGFSTVCLGCDPADPCTGGDVCGLGDPVSPVRAVPVDCIAPGTRELGEPCHGDPECATGVCNGGVCSTCDDAHPCAGAETCGAAWANNPAATRTAFVCSPNQHLRAHGEPCASDDDCASRACSGAVRQQCDDGRSCATAADCPFGTGGANGLQNGPCNAVGLQGGSCQ